MHGKLQKYINICIETQERKRYLGRARRRCGITP
jgi:hypothetical protein